MNIDKQSDFYAIYKLAYISAIIMLIFVPLQVIVYIVFPPPTTATVFPEKSTF